MHCSNGAFCRKTYRHRLTQKAKRWQDHSSINSNTAKLQVERQQWVDNYAYSGESTMNQAPLMYYFDFCNNSVRTHPVFLPFIDKETEVQCFSDLPKVITSQWWSSSLNSTLPSCNLCLLYEHKHVLARETQNKMNDQRFLLLTSSLFFFFFSSRVFFAFYVSDGLRATPDFKEIFK